MQNLGRAIEEGDMSALRRAAHTMKGATRIFGVPTIQELAAYMEKKAADNEPADFVEIYEDLQPMTDTLKRELKDYIKNL